MRTMNEPSAPLPEDRAPIIYPIFPKLDASIQQAYGRVRSLLDSGQLEGITQIQLMGVAQNFAVAQAKQVFRPEEAARQVHWLEHDGVSYMYFAGVALRFNKVDGDLLPCRQRTWSDQARWQQGVLFNDLYAQPGESGQVPTLTVGMQWAADMAQAPVVYLVALFQGALLWSKPITRLDDHAASVHEIRSTGVAGAKRVRSTRPKQDESGGDELTG
jgi:hypothetical protein